MRGERITIDLAVALIMETCVECGVPFGMLESFKKERLRDGKTFWCPSGHGQIYTKSLEEQLKQAQKETQDVRINLHAALLKNKQLSNDILDKTQEMQRLQKRITNGVCPHCHRTFQQLARHMKSKHGA